MRGEELVGEVRKAKQDFGANCPKKFAGAAAVEVLRAALRGEGIFASRRDVFVRGVPVEVDLIVPHREGKPVLGLLYEPNQVAVALEVKKSGSFGEGTLDKIKRDFAWLRTMGVYCAYVTFEERHNYRWRATRKKLRYPCFTLAWHKRTDGPLTPTRDWESFVAFLRTRLSHNNPIGARSMAGRSPLRTTPVK